MTIATLIEEISAVKSTSSGKVEWNSNSLETVVTYIKTLLLERGAMQVDTVEDMQAVSGAESNLVLVTDVGLFQYISSGSADGSTSYNASGGGIWQIVANYSSGGGGATDLSDLDDVNLGSLTDGESLVYNSSSGKWVNAPRRLDTLNDTDIDTPTTGQILKYDGTTWVNENFTYAWENLTGLPNVVQEYDPTDPVATNNIGLPGAFPDESDIYGNIGLGIDPVPAMTAGTWNTVIAPRGIADFNNGTLNVIITPNEQIHSSGVPGYIGRSTIIGSIGDIDALYSGGTMQGVMALGAAGETYIASDINGNLFYGPFDYAFAGLADHTFIGSGYFTDGLIIEGLLQGEDVTLSGLLTAPEIAVSDWTSFTAPELGTGWSLISGTAARWRIDPMGKVQFSGAIEDTSGGTPDTVAITFANSDLTPARDEAFAIARTDSGITTSYEHATAVVKTNGTLEILKENVASAVYFWLSNISYYID